MLILQCLTDELDEEFFSDAQQELCPYLKVVELSDERSIN